MQDDSELLRRFVAERSNEAFSDLVRRHLSLVYFSALRRANGDAHLARDIVQIVFISLAREAASLQRRSVLAGWLYVATRNATAKAMRREQRRTARELEAHAMQQSTMGTSSDWDRIQPHLEAVLDDLPERDRDAVLLRFFGSRSFAEIGQTLRVSDDAARMRVDRALEKLRVLLNRRGITSTTSALAIAMETQAHVATPADLAAAVQGALAASGALTEGATMGTAVSIFKSMNTTSVTVGCAGIIALFTLGAAVYRSNQASDAQIALSASHAANTSADPSLLTQPARVAAAAVPTAAPSSSTTQLSTEATTAVDTGKKKRKVSPSFTETMKDPAQAESWRQRKTAAIDAQFVEAFSVLNLPPEQLERVKQLMLVRAEAWSETLDVSQAAGLSRIELRQALKQSQVPFNEQIKALVGETQYAVLERHEQADPALRGLVSASLASDLQRAGVPLSPEQMTDVTASLFRYVEDTWLSAGLPLVGGMAAFTKPNEADPQTGLTAHAQELLQRFAQRLSPEQLDVTRKYFLDQTAGKKRVTQSQ